VAFRNVKVGQRVDSLWVVDDGLKPGERVVVEGLQRISDGMTVAPKPAPVATSGTGASQPAPEGK
jgi:membrane fusion protein (multidrug efflux system)